MTPVTHPTAGPQDAPPPRRFLRGWFCASLLIGLGMLVGVSWFARGYDEIFRQMEMHHLPFPTEGMLALGRVVRTTGGAIAVVAIGAVLTIVACRGFLDKILIKLVVVNCIWITLLLPFAYLSLHMPIAQIQRHLEEK